MAAIFTAFDISTVSTSVSTLLTGVIGVGLLFLAFRLGKKALGIRV